MTPIDAGQLQARALAAVDRHFNGCLDPLTAALTLLVDHVRGHLMRAPGVADVLRCWVTDPPGRELLNVLADRLASSAANNLPDSANDVELVHACRPVVTAPDDPAVAGLAKHGLIAAVKAARSKRYIGELSAPLRLGIAVPMRDEAARVRQASPDSPEGQDAVRAKWAQLDWLTAGQPLFAVDLVFVDEAVPFDSALAASESLSRLAEADAHRSIYATALACPRSIADDPSTAKGGAVTHGLRYLIERGCDVVMYTDLDLTYPLQQVGLLLGRMSNPVVGVAIGSRRRPDSFGYYPSSGPNATGRLYQQAVTELLKIPEISDPQAGFKAFRAHVAEQILGRSIDHSLTFDTEFLVLAKLNGHELSEIGVCAFHNYQEGASAARDYGRMLDNVRAQADRLGIDVNGRPTPTLDRIRKCGGFHQTLAKMRNEGFADP
jgi:hypothetical protein